jgi:hypothetical protein
LRERLLVCQNSQVGILRSKRKNRLHFIIDLVHRLFQILSVITGLCGAREGGGQAQLQRDGEEGVDTLHEALQKVGVRLRLQLLLC